MKTRKELETEIREIFSNPIFPLDSLRKKYKKLVKELKKVKATELLRKQTIFVKMQNELINHYNVKVPRIMLLMKSFVGKKILTKDNFIMEKAKEQLNQFAEKRTFEKDELNFRIITSFNTVNGNYLIITFNIEVWNKDLKYSCDMQKHLCSFETSHISLKKNGIVNVLFNDYKIKHPISLKNELSRVKVYKASLKKYEAAKKALNPDFANQFVFE